VVLRRSAKTEIIFNHGVRSDWYLSWIRQIELAEDDLVAPDLAKEVLEDLNCQLLAGTPAVSKSEWGKAGIVANRKALPIDNAENRAKSRYS
jgi:hypothetical protein